MLDSVTQEDLNYLANVDFLDWEKIRDSSILVTGATGQIGSEIVKLLIILNETKKLNIKIIALIRNEEKAKTIYECFDKDFIKFLCQDITNPINIDEKIDYIIHTANSTTSKDFITKPVETINSIYIGTKNILDFAKSRIIKSMIYLSSMEVYGIPNDDKKIYEKDIGQLDSMLVRNSYPIGKLVAENLCVSEFSEYKLPIKIVRLTQTIGGLITQNDNRVWANFVRKSARGENIVLHTKGETKRNYLYITDAVSAIFAILLNGENGQIYNAANEETYCSILEMANVAAILSKDRKTKIVFEFLDDSVTGYQAVKKVDLSSEKLQKLGWKPSVDLKTAFAKMIKQLKQSK